MHWGPSVLKPYEQAFRALDFWKLQNTELPVELTDFAMPLVLENQYSQYRPRAHKEAELRCFLDGKRVREARF